MPQYLVVTDTPGIKKYVFGTDALAEIRGASALLDRLNRAETTRTLSQCLGQVGGRLERTVYANGGSGQFLVQADDDLRVRDALSGLCAFYRQETRGEVTLAFGYAPLIDRHYSAALATAFSQLRSRREMESGRLVAELMPFMKECESASHLPAARVAGPDGRLCSQAVIAKRDEVRRSRAKDRWAQWMHWLAKEHAGWPEYSDVWEDLRCDDITGIGSKAWPEGSVGLVYADGNAMGQLVQELDSDAARAEFSTLVDESITVACFRSLAAVCAKEIKTIRDGANSRGVKVPAEILLLGGDDLLVVLPADRALGFASRVMELFEELTRVRIRGLTDPELQSFFNERIGQNGLTTSCGVAIARDKYPFYLMLDLAEQLLASAKTGGSRDSRSSSHYWAPSYVDFHMVVGSSGQDLGQVREFEYLVSTGEPRTLRPYSSSDLERLRSGVIGLRRANFPRSKVHDLYEAALESSPVKAERRIREIFSRCKGKPPLDHRQALWDAIAGLVTVEKLAGKAAGPPMFNFPWCSPSGRGRLGIVDLAEAYDLFPHGAEE